MQICIWEESLSLIQEEKSSFLLHHKTLDQLFILSRIFEGASEFAQPVDMCFVDLEETSEHVPWGVLWWELACMGYEAVVSGHSVLVQP